MRRSLIEQSMPLVKKKGGRAVDSWRFPGYRDWSVRQGRYNADNSAIDSSIHSVPRGHVLPVHPGYNAEAGGTNPVVLLREQVRLLWKAAYLPARQWNGLGNPGEACFFSDRHFDPVLRSHRSAGRSGRSATDQTAAALNGALDMENYLKEAGVAEVWGFIGEVAACARSVPDTGMRRALIRKRPALPWKRRRLMYSPCSKSWA